MINEFNPKFQDGEKVLLDGKIVTVNEWGYTLKQARYTYTIIENPATFYFEHELKKLLV